MKAKEIIKRLEQDKEYYSRYRKINIESGNDNAARHCDSIYLYLDTLLVVLKRGE